MNKLKIKLKIIQFPDIYVTDNIVNGVNRKGYNHDGNIKSAVTYLRKKEIVEFDTFSR